MTATSWSIETRLLWAGSLDSELRYEPVEEGFVAVSVYQDFQSRSNELRGDCLTVPIFRDKHVAIAGIHTWYESSGIHLGISTPSADDGFDRAARQFW